MRFRPSEGTVGVEYELQLVDAASLELVDRVFDVIDDVADAEFVKTEFIQSTVEVVTPVCDDIAGVERSLRQVLGEVRAVCQRLGIGLIAAGTHPFSRRLASITPLPRYQKMATRTGIIGRTQITFALQVHIGVASAAQAVALMRELHGFLPVLLALSASSPFWYGHDTGYTSWRQRLLAADRTYGIPPRFADWQAVQDLFDTGVRAGIIRGWRDIHWDIRPRPDYGTVEIRVMDAPPTLSEAVALAAFTRALAVYLLRTPPVRRPQILPRPLPWWLERENHFQASRQGIDAAYVAAQEPMVRSLRDIIDATIDAVSPTAAELGDGGFLAPLGRILASPSYVRQRANYRVGAIARDVAVALASELETDLATTDSPRCRPPRHGLAPPAR